MLSVTSTGKSSGAVRREPERRETDKGGVLLRLKIKSVTLAYGWLQRLNGDSAKFTIPNTAAASRLIVHPSPPPQ